MEELEAVSKSADVPSSRVVEDGRILFSWDFSNSNIQCILVNIRICRENT